MPHPRRRRALAGLTSLLLAITGVVFGAVPAAHAAVAFSDDFSGGSSGWTAQYWTVEGGSALHEVNGVGNWGSIQRTVDLSLYQNVQLSYSYSITGNVDQSLVVSVRPDTGSGYSAVATHSSNTGGWSSNTVSISLADFEPDVGIQFAVTTRGVGQSAPGGFEIRIDNVQITGDIDTSAPMISAVVPISGAMLPNSTPYDFSVSVLDDFSNPEDVEIRYIFELISDPSINFIAPSMGWDNPNASGVYSFVRTPSSIRSSLSTPAVPSGSAIRWSAQVQDEAGNYHEVFIGSFLAGEVPAVFTSGPPPAGVVGTPYSHQITATGNPAPTFNLELGSDPLPPNLTLTSAGLISGTPSAAGSYTFTVQANVPPLIPVTQTYTITITSSAEPPVMTSGSPADGHQMQAYTHTFTADGTGPITFSIVDPTDLPTGLILSGSVLSGTITGAPGNYPFELRASNGITADTITAYTITVHAPPVAPTITSAAPGAATYGQAYSFTVTATGDPTVQFSSSDLAPLGLGIHPTSGTISGTPTTAGSFPVQVTVSNGVSPDAVADYTLVIHENIIITSPAPPNGQVGTPYSHTFTGTGSGPISYSVIAGALPDNLSLTGATLSGTPTLDGPFSFTIRATTGTGPVVDTAHSITISPAPPLITVTSTPPTAGIVGDHYSHFVTIDGPVSPNFAITAGNLPGNLTLNSGTGEISGTPTAEGTTVFSITITDSGRLPITVPYSLTIAPANDDGGSTGGGGDSTGGAGDASGLANTGVDGSPGHAQVAIVLTLLGIALLIHSRRRVSATRPSL